MATVDRDFADNLVQHSGYYNGDSANDLGDNPRAIEITEYTNAWGDLSYGVTFEGETNKYQSSEYIRNPRQYWKYQS